MFIRTFVLLVAFAACAMAISADNSNRHCLRNLTSLTELRNIFALGDHAYTLEDLFCYSELARYKNPSLPADLRPEGYVCLDKMDKLAGETDAAYARRVQMSIVTRDGNALSLYRKLGGPHGYQRTAEVSRGYSQEEIQADENYPFGTGASSKDNVPVSWCAVYMREMVCHILFPQGFGAPKDRNIRPVCYKHCKSTFQHCNRREFTSGETSDSFKDPELVPTYNRYLAENTSIPNEEVFVEGVKMDNEYYCSTWNWGWGPIAPFRVAAVTEDDEKTYDEFCVPYNGAMSSVVPSILMVVMMLFAVAALL
eukprot:PhM_4_TR17054/c0_g1_i1/m.18419